MASERGPVRNIIDRAFEAQRELIDFTARFLVGKAGHAELTEISRRFHDLRGEADRLDMQLKVGEIIVNYSKPDATPQEEPTDAN